jgi:DNA-binding beta-propeller fold protein YncE
MPYNLTPLTGEETGILKDWINNGARDNNGNVPYSNPDNKVYVCNQGSDQIYEIDTDYNLVSRIISVDFNASIIEAPHNVQIYGNYYYVTLIATGQLLKIDRNTNSVVGAVGGIEYAGMINISPDGKTAYVSRSSTAPGDYQKIFAVNTESMTIKGEINFPIPGLPHAIWLTRNGDKLYVANMTRDRISIVNTSTLELVGNDILLSLSGSTAIHQPMHIYLSPDDKYLYVNCRLSSKMLIINTETKNIVQELTIKHHPMQAAISEDGNKIYVVSHHEPVITEITKSGESWAITREFTNDAFHYLYGADLSPDGKFLYVTCSNQTNDFKPRYHVPGKIAPSLVCVYDVNTGDLVKIIDVGSFATGIAARQNWK